MYVCPWALQEPYGDKGEGSWLSFSKALSLTGKQCSVSRWTKISMDNKTEMDKASVKEVSDYVTYISNFYYQTFLMNL